MTWTVPSTCNGTPMILLDTCALIYDALTPHRLSRKAKASIESADVEGDLALSDISLWETAMLVRHGRLETGTSVDEFLRLALTARKIRILPISVEIAALSSSLDLHGDPADRIIAATAIIHRAKLVTSDKLLRRNSAVPTLW